MGLVKGTNSGFVEIAPTADPLGENTPVTSSDWAHTQKDTAPARAARVIEIGWWCSGPVADANFEVGIYNHHVGDNNPEAVVGSLSLNNAKGTTEGWKRVTGLNIPVVAGEIYWIALQTDVGTAALIDRKDEAGEKSDHKGPGETELTDPWGVSDGTNARLIALYALVAGAVPSSTVKGDTGTSGTRAISKRYPVEEGLIAGSTKQTGKPYLEEQPW